MNAEWPVVDTEVMRWDLSLRTDISASQRREFGQYRAAVVPRIADLIPHLNTSVLASADEASAEIVRFDAEMGGEIAPFAAVLLRSESASSSQIEHLTASAKAIALAEIGDTSKRNASEIVANTRAMTAATKLADRLDDAAILAMHHALMESNYPAIAGKWRDEPVWIGGRSPRTAEFVPPRYEEVPNAIDDLVKFMDRSDIPALAHAAIVHAQFETIHPFPDGNGRTGRALVHAMLRGKGLARNVTVPVSAGLLTDLDSYFGSLTRYRDGNPDPIVESFAFASFAAVRNGRRLVHDLRTIRSEWSTTLSGKDREGSALGVVLTSLARQPVVDSAYLQGRLGLSEPTARRILSDLENVGIVKEFTGMRRNRCWRSDQILRALDAFAERAGRRGMP